jgi:hypothetical protein
LVAPARILSPFEVRLPARVRRRLTLPDELFPRT